MNYNKSQQTQENWPIWYLHH